MELVVGVVGKGWWVVGVDMGDGCGSRWIYGRWIVDMMDSKYDGLDMAVDMEDSTGIGSLG